MNFSKKTWTSSHVYGDSSYNHHRKLFYVNIPKCASMWMREYLAMLGDTPENTWVGGNFTDNGIAEYTPIILLRDPIKRWASHCPAADTVLNIKNNNQELDYTFTQLKFWITDEHSAPQSDFISGLDIKDAVFFYCDNHLSKNIEHYLKSIGFNVSAPNPVNEQLVKYSEQSLAWNEILNRPEYFKKFEQYFQKDYDLIRSVNFYRNGE